MGNGGWLLFNGKLKVENNIRFIISFYWILIKYFIFSESIKINSIKKAKKNGWGAISFGLNSIILYLHIYLYVVSKELSLQLNRIFVLRNVIGWVFKMRWILSSFVFVFFKISYCNKKQPFFGHQIGCSLLSRGIKR